MRGKEDGEQVGCRSISGDKGLLVNKWRQGRKEDEEGQESRTGWEQERGGEKAEGRITRKHRQGNKMTQQIPVERENINNISQIKIYEH